MLNFGKTFAPLLTMSSSMYLQMSLEARPLVTAMVEDTTV